MLLVFSLEVKPGESKMIRITYVSTEKIPIDRGVGGYVLNLEETVRGFCLDGSRV